MNDITKLADKFKTMSCDGDSYDVGLECAELLEAALPTWTLITDNPDTWPDGPAIVACKGCPELLDFTDDGWLIAEHYPFGIIGLSWRPLCSLDYPPSKPHE